ncbi:hypothetical protein V6N13_016994 [Hibiscus sabdariffa]
MFEKGEGTRKVRPLAQAHLDAGQIEVDVDEWAARNNDTRPCQVVIIASRIRSKRERFYLVDRFFFDLLLHQQKFIRV